MSNVRRIIACLIFAFVSAMLAITGHASGIPAQSIKMERLLMKPGESRQAVVTVTGYDGGTLGKDDVNLYYTSDNEAVAGVNPVSGVVSSKTPGRAVITIYGISEGGGRAVLGRGEVLVTTDALIAAYGYARQQENLAEFDYVIENFSGNTCDVRFITAAYEEGRLMEVKLQTISLGAESNISGRETVSRLLSDGEIKTFLLSDDDNQTPYCSPLHWREAANAVTIRKEAENFTAPVLNFTPQYLTSGDLSGGKLAYLWKQRFSPDFEYGISYTLSCDCPGIYELQMVTSNLEGGWTANFSVSVNGDDAVVGTDGRLVEKITAKVSGIADDLLAKYSLGEFALKKGENTVTINIESKNWMNTGVSFYIDYLEFIPAAQGNGEFSLIGHNSPLKIFEEGNDAAFDILLEGVAEDNERFSYSITDYFGNLAGSGIVNIAQGGFIGGVYAGGLSTGWYRIKVSSTSCMKESSFAIVPKAVSRSAGANSPFATDLASAWNTQNYYEQKKYAAAAKLAGSSWIRERFLWREAEASSGKYSFLNLIGDTAGIKKQDLKIINCFHEAPSWAVNSGDSLPSNPQIMYNFIINAIKSAGAYTDVWEIWNEQDASLFSNESADRYAAMMKAAAIAADNIEGDAFVALGGLSRIIYGSEYNNLLLQNRVMDYADVYNYHTHLPYELSDSAVPVPNQRVLEANRFASMLYDSDEKPVWVTESGLKQFLKPGESTLTKEQCIAQARYVVTAFAEEIAKGVDKQFLFIGLPFVEAGADFGTFDKKGEPRPSYAAAAVMTRLLDGTSYLGEVHSLPEPAKGYAMQSNTKITEILWSEEKTLAELPASSPVIVCDIMGGKTYMYPKNNKISVYITSDPVYVIYPKSASPDNYYPRQRSYRSLHKNELTDTQKLVLFADFPVRKNESDKEKGYSLSYSESNTVSVRVYNFSDTDMTGYLQATADSDEAFSVACPQQEKVVPANGYASFEIAVGSNNNTVFGSPYILKLTGIFGGCETSPLVAKIRFDRGPEKLDFIQLRNSNTTSGWEKQISSGASASITSSGEEIQFDVSSNGGNIWNYPFVYLRYQSLSDYDGIRFSVYFDEDVNNQTYNNMNVQIFSSSNKFFLGTAPIKMKKGWNEYAFTWDEFCNMSDSSVKLSPELLSSLKYVSIGINTTLNNVTYKLKNVGFFTTGDKPLLPEIVVTGQSAGNSVISVTASLPDGVMKTGTKVFLDGVLQPHEVTGSNLIYTASGISSGPHEILIAAYTPTGRAVYKVMEITEYNNE